MSSDPAHRKCLLGACYSQAAGLQSIRLLGSPRKNTDRGDVDSPDCRLLRNRVSAQQARERKKSYVSNLEQAAKGNEQTVMTACTMHSILSCWVPEILHVHAHVQVSISASMSAAWPIGCTATTCS